MTEVKHLRPRSSKSIAKFWDGFELHPFVTTIHEVLGAIGLRFYKQSSDSGHYQWRKEITHEFLLELVISSARRASTPVGYVSLEAWLTVRSRSVQQIEAALALHECNEHEVRTLASREDSKAVIVYVLDQWLKCIQNPNAPGSRYVAQFNSDDLNTWSQVGDSLVHLISIIEENVSRDGGVVGEIAMAPKSSVAGPLARTIVSRPIEFLAILYAAGGDRERAITALDAGTTAATEKDDSVELCRLRRLKAWLVGSS